jgi:ketosteroid isomerase-like protein
MIADQHPNVEILRSIYADLTLLGEYADDGMVLHDAERQESDGRHVGRQAAVDKERALIESTGGTLLMDVEAIIANDYFGTVIGVLRASRDGRDLAMPFCGLWRFKDGRIVAHWENAYDASEIRRFLSGP